MRYARILVLPALIVVLGPLAELAGQKKFALTIDNLMRGPGLIGYEPTAVRWSGDGKRIYFQWKQASDARDKPTDTYVVDRDGSGLRKLSEEESRLAPPAFGDRSRDRNFTVYAFDGDILLWDHSTDTRRQITKTADIESDPRFLRDGRRISFVRGGNLYVMALDTGLIEQLTEIRAPGAGDAAPATGGGGGSGRGGRGQGGPPPILTGGGRSGGSEQQRGTDSQEFLKKEERELLEVVRERAARREETEERRKKDHPRKPFQLQARQSAGGLQPCPDEKCVIANVIEAGDRVKSSIVPNYVTESAYTEEIGARSSVGDSQFRNRLAILSVETGEATWIDHGQKDRDVQLFNLVWSEDGTKAVLQARAADNKDRWILALDPATGKTRVLFTEHDDAWLNGPGAFTLGWLKNNEEVYFQSERDGWSHLYKAGFSGGEPKQLTSGKFEVQSVQLSNDKSQFYLTTSEASLYEQHYYSMSVDGGTRTQITRTPGIHRMALSRDEQWLADVYSYTNRPPELYVQPNVPAVESKKLTASPAAEFWDYAWTDPPIVEFKARDGVTLPARLYKAANFRRGGPAVIFVHGAGYLQNVTRGWSSYSANFMFHHLLMERGYAVLDLDYRASAGYGRDWRAAIYRHMGGKDLDDHVDGAKWLVAQHGVDAKRIGIYGGSYGGFITLMAMFTAPDTFAAGAALRPVTDWAHYNHGYTSNILNVPQKDAEAYKKSSPIYFASGLKGALLICHGMVDVNVHFQDSVRLVQKLIELRKENWEFAVYPVEDHGFVQPTSWADEYKRIFKLFEDNLKKDLKM